MTICRKKPWITWIKRILGPNNKTVLNEIYQQRLNKFGRALLFECDFSEKDILNHLRENSFFTDELLAWNKMIKREAKIDFSNEIIWNNSNIYVGNSTIFY